MLVSSDEANLASVRGNLNSRFAKESDHMVRNHGRSSVKTVPSSLTQQDSPAWLRSLGSTIQHHDSEIVNYFLNLFKIGLVPAFPTFETFQVTESTLADLILAIAAVGGLLSTIEGSFKIARSMYADARRLLFNRVSSSWTILSTATFY